MSQDHKTKELEARPSKKIIVPEKQKGQIGHLEKVESVSAIAEDAKATIANEIKRYQQRSSVRGLDLKEARVLSQLVDSLVKLSREEREASREFDAGNLSEEELMAQLKKLIGDKDD